MATKRKGSSRKPQKRSTHLRQSARPARTSGGQASTKSAASKKSGKPKYVYYFGDGQADGTGKMKPLLGGKGANLAEMSRIGLPVPPGFTITTEVCTYYYDNKKTYPKSLEPAVKAGVAQIEKIMGTRFGDTVWSALTCLTPTGTSQPPETRLSTSCAMVLAMSVRPAAMSGGKPRPMSSADEIATGVPNPAAPSISAPKAKAMRSA